MIEGATRADTWEWSLFIDGKNWGVFDAKEGGEVDSDVQVYKPGGMADPDVIGGTRSTSNVIFRRNYRLGRDHARSQALIDGAGSVVLRAVGQPLDHNKNPWGDPFTYHGIMKRVKFPDHDSQATDPAMLEIEATIAGFPTGMST